MSIILENRQSTRLGTERVLFIANGDDDSSVEQMVELLSSLRLAGRETFLLIEASRPLPPRITQVLCEVVIPFRQRQRNKESAVYLTHLDGLLDWFDPDMIVYDLDSQRELHLSARWSTRFRYSAAVVAAAQVVAVNTCTETLPGGLQQMLSLVSGVDCQTEALKKLESLARSLTSRPFFVLRIDNVMTESDNLAWLLSLLAEHNLHASLEVVPHQFSVSGKWLDRWDADRQRLEVSQHGYSHANEPGHSPAYTQAPTIQTRQLIQTGMEALSRAFPDRFKMGFSSPVGVLPGWLPAFWRSIGGQHVSAAGSDVGTSHLPCVKGLTEVWSWRQERFRTAASIAAGVARNFVVRGYGGFVINPECLTCEQDKSRLRQLLEAISSGFCKSRPVSSLATLPAELTFVTGSRRYNHLSRPTEAGATRPTK